ncbi:MAG: DUF2589 domain-containing protein [Actinomycetota bacterium]
MVDKKDNVPAAGGDDIPDVSLSAAILAPLTALVKAQVHNSRAFLSYLLQLGYSHVKMNEHNEPVIDDPSQLTPFTLPFVNKVQIDGHEVLQQVTIPALALVPSVPLGVESAEFEYDFLAERYAPHTQLQTKRGEKADEDPTKRPWYLVEDPVSLRGNVVDGGDKAGAGTTDKAWSRNRSSIHIKIKVGQMAVPSGLDKLLSTLTQAATVHNLPTKPAEAKPQ